LGEVNLFDPAGAVCSVEAVEPTEYWVISREAFEKFINQHHKAGSIVLIGLAMTLSKRIRETTQKQASLARKKRNPLVWVGFAILSIFAIAATWNWIGGAERLNKLGYFYKKQTTEVEQALKESELKVKNLETEIARLQDEMEFVKSDAEKKASSSVAPVQKTSANPVAEPETPAPSTAPEPEPSPATESGAAKEEASSPKTEKILLSYPPEITLVAETTVPLTVNGKISGSAKIAPGKTFKVVGVDGDEVLVTMAGSTVRIPKENSNFDEALETASALAAEKAKALRAMATPVPAKPTPKPSPTPTPSQESHASEMKNHASDAASPVVQIEKMMNTLAPLKVLDALQDLHKPGKENARLALLKSESRKWEQTAERAKDWLRNDPPADSMKMLLRNIILTSEMLQTERFDGIEGKLREIDATWLAYKTDLEIYGPEGAPKRTTPQE
jgi:uncharacterized small protein (DUF1192 family)